MARPFQFADDRDGACSPFNRQLLTSPISEPSSFKTNVNRSKTRKWTEAKAYTYDGDDWGGYDPYDEYGSYHDDPESEPQRQPHPQTQPQSQSSLPAEPPRRNSFEAGDESTTFSSGTASQPDPTRTTPIKPGPDYTVRRDFSQIAHVPPPLQTRASPQATRDQVPARKSSLPSSPAQNVSSPQSQLPGTEKLLPFIRPSDIYKRLEEERDKEKSPVEPTESTELHQGFTVDNPALAQAIGARVASPERATENTSLDAGLPPVDRVASGFGPDFWNSSALTSVTAPEPAQDLQHQPSLGFRSAVNQAFDRHDDSSVPPTPISRDNSQSQHGSETSGISPIMSRVPSAATAEAKARAAEARETVPPIAEEGSLSGSPGHSRNVSAEGAPAAFTQGFRRSLDTPSPNNSPAKTPMLEYTKRLSHPMVAENDAHDTSAVEPPPEERSVASVRVTHPSADYSRRESDIAAEVTSSPPKEAAGAAQASQVARAHFLQTHESTESLAPTSPVLRATSPVGRGRSPGPSRVRDLAGKYNEISRSNSAMSVSSKTSDRSFKRTNTYESNYSDGRDQAESSKRDESEERLVSRPDLTQGPSFRPHLPGEWVSFVSTKGSQPPVTAETDREQTVVSNEPTTEELEQSTPVGLPRATEDLDLTPSTVKQPLAHRDITPHQTSPLDAVKAAGDALGSALMSTVGLNHGTKDFAQPEPEPQPSPGEHVERSGSGPRPSVGDIYLRPLSVNRTASSIASTSAGPTPPPKDSPKGLDLEGFSGYFPQPVLRVQSEGLSPVSDYSPEGMESDRLRKEIERSLIPSGPSDQQTRGRGALDALEDLREAQRLEGLSTQENPTLMVSPAPANAVKETPAGTEKATQRISSAPLDLLGKRFSFEKDQGSSKLFGEVGETPRAAYERPLSGAGLHVVNTSISTDSEVSSVEDAPLSEAAPIAEQDRAETAPLEAVLSPLSPVTSPDLPPASGDVQTVAPTALRDSADETPLPSLPATAESTSTPPSSASAARIPPFREILALKSANERIDTFNSTRDQFASTDTGLTSWLSRTLSSNPEHAHLLTDSPDKVNADLANAKHKHQPSIMKMAKGLGSSSRDVSGSHAAIPEVPSGVERQNSQARSPLQHAGVEKMQTRGKDLLHSAGMLGGKATFGAKGFFAKAKGRLREGGSEKASDRAPTPSALASPTKDLPATSVAPTPSTSNTGDNDTKSRTRSQPSNRFSTAFTRMRSQSRPSSVLLSPTQGPDVTISPENQPTPLDLPSSADVAPWADEPITPHATKGLSSRIGLLPSPAFGGSLKSQGGTSEVDINGPALMSDEASGPGKEDEILRNERSDLQSKEHVSPVVGQHDVALPQDVPVPETSQVSSAYALGNIRALPGLTTTAKDNSVEEEPFPVSPLDSTHEANSEEPVAEQRLVSRRSSISSIGSANDKGQPISPPAERPSSPAAAAEPPSDAQPETTLQEESSTTTRPPLIGRSSLPSQQRPPDKPRSLSYTWRAGSRAGSRTSLALADFPTPQRSISAQLPYAPFERTESPVFFSENRTPEEKSDGSRLDTQAGTRAGSVQEEAPSARIKDIPQDFPAASGSVDSGQPAPAPGMYAPALYTPTEVFPAQQRVYTPTKMIPPQQQVFTPTEITPAEQQGMVEPSYFDIAPAAAPSPKVAYRQPSFKVGEPAIHEDVERGFSPAVMDPRQQGIEYQLPGVGPPEEIRQPRGVRGLFRGSLSSPPPPERINPNMVVRNPERSFSGDIVQTQEAQQAKKEKRRASVFGAFSRTSSISGLSDSLQSRGNSRGNTSTNTADVQGSTASLVAAQNARGDPGRGNTLKKMQRSSTSAGAGTPDPEKKLKRFSRLGSIFGRSNSEARKGNKLIKNMPKSQTPPVSEAVVSQQRAPQNVPALPAQYGGIAEEPDVPEQQWQPEHEPAVAPPPGGWYAPTSRRSSYNSEMQPTLPNLTPAETSTSWQASPQPTRRLHSEGFRHGPRYQQPEYRSMSPAPYQPPAPYQQQRLTGNYDTGPVLRSPHQRQLSGGDGSLPRNFSWGTGADGGPPQQYYPQPQEPSERLRSNGAITPSHSRNASFGEATAGTPPMFHVPSGGLQRASSPSMYGPAPYMESPTKQPYARYTYPTQPPGPPQQPSSPGMYYRQGARDAYARPSGVNSRHNSLTGGMGSRHNSLTGGMGSRHNSLTGGMGSRHNSLTGGGGGGGGGGMTSSTAAIDAYTLQQQHQQQQQQQQQMYGRQRYYNGSVGSVGGGGGGGGRGARQEYGYYPPAAGQGGYTQY